MKRSHKGTPKHVNLQTNDYEAALFENKIRRAEFNRIVTDVRIGSATTKTTNKRSINPIYLKMRVENDLITVTPHRNEHGYI